MSMSTDLIVEHEKADRRVDGLAGLCTNANHFQVGFVDFLGELIHGCVGRSADEHGTAVEANKLVNGRCASESFQFLE